MLKHYLDDHKVFSIEKSNLNLFDFYRNCFCYLGDSNERNFIEKLQSNEYLKLGDYLERDKQSAVKASIRCIQDHGLKYTGKLIVRRYVMKQNV